MNNTSQETHLTGWSVKEAASFTPWRTISYSLLPKRLAQWISPPKTEVYAPINLRSSISKGEPLSQIYETILYEPQKGRYQPTGFFIYRFSGTKHRVKKLTLSLEGDEGEHANDTKKFSEMCDLFSMNSTLSPLPAKVHDRISSKNSKSEAGHYVDPCIGDSGHVFYFANFNAMSFRETQVRGYVLTIFSPDVTRHGF